MLRELFYARLLDGRIRAGNGVWNGRPDLDIDLLRRGLGGGALVLHRRRQRRDALSALSVQQLAGGAPLIGGIAARLSLYNDWVAVLDGLYRNRFTIYDSDPCAGPGLYPGGILSGPDADRGRGRPLRRAFRDWRGPQLKASTALWNTARMVGRGTGHLHRRPGAGPGGQVLTFEEADERALTAAVKLGGEAGGPGRGGTALAGTDPARPAPPPDSSSLFLPGTGDAPDEDDPARRRVALEEVFGTGFTWPDSGLRGLCLSLEELEGLVRWSAACGSAALIRRQSDGLRRKDGGDGQGVYPAATTRRATCRWKSCARICI